MSKERDLIQPGVTRRGGVWADLGSGTGIFTLVLRELLGPDAQIYSVDRTARDLEKQRRAFDTAYPGTAITYMTADFTEALELPPLDGIVMANALHFVPFDRQQATFNRLAEYLKPEGGRFIIVEYEAQHGNMWVPYPVDYAAFEFLASNAGLRDMLRLSAVPSRFLNEMYSGLALRKKL